MYKLENTHRYTQAPTKSQKKARSLHKVYGNDNIKNEWRREHKNKKKNKRANSFHDKNIIKSKHKTSLVY